MQKYRQYRMLRKVKKVLNTPVKEDIYIPVNEIYVSDRTLNKEDSILDPGRKLQITQVRTVARLLLQQITRLSELLEDVHRFDHVMGSEVEATFTDIHILFEELDRGVLLTEAEKAARRIDGAQNGRHRCIANDQATSDLATLRLQLQGWQQENTRCWKKLNRVENGIRDLALNVNHVRCTQILLDRKSSIAALDSSVDHGISLLKAACSKVQIVCANLECLPQHTQPIGDLSDQA